MTDPQAPRQGDSRQALATEVARLWRRLDESDGALRTLTEEIEHLQGKVGELTGLVAHLAGTQDDATRAPGPIWWPDVTNSAERRDAWNVLGAWVDEVLRARHPDRYQSLRKCWYRHPDVVDELSALRVAWNGAYRDARASATAAIEWHDRWLPACIARCVKATAGCKSGHEPVDEHKSLDADGEFSAFIETEIAGVPSS